MSIHVYMSYTNINILLDFIFKSGILILYILHLQLQCCFLFSAAVLQSCFYKAVGLRESRRILLLEISTAFRPRKMQTTHCDL